MSAPYTTEDLLAASVGGKQVLRRLSSRAGDETDHALVFQLIDEASGIIDSKANGSPGYPWAVNPNQAINACNNIVLYLMEQRVYGTTQFRQAYEDTIAELDLLLEGRVSWVTTLAATEKSLSFYAANPNDKTDRRARLSRMSHSNDLDSL